MDYIPLEKPIADLEMKIVELKRLSVSQSINLDQEVATLEQKVIDLRHQIFSSLSHHEIAQLSRHPKRPTALDVITRICDNFTELHGDRNFLDDAAIVGGLGVIGGERCVVMGHQKGRDTKENIHRNFGMPKPEGYRKALRLMSMAERFQLPIITFIDTPGAYPGVGAEERGQSEAIAKNIMVMSKLKVPIISVVIGEGGSGGALAIAVANRVHMLQYSIYSVISPEGCASILMKDALKAPEAAAMLKLTAPHTLDLKVIDSIIEEPIGGAHRDKEQVSTSIKNRILKDLAELKAMKPEKLRKHRQDRFLRLGEVLEG